jgi:hypothetical protein
LSNFQKYQRNTTNTTSINIFRSSGNSKNSKKPHTEKSTDKQRRTPIISAFNGYTQKTTQKKLQKTKESADAIGV